MEYVILHVTREDLRRAADAAPARLGTLSLPAAGYNLYLSPYRNPCGCTHLGVFRTESAASAAAAAHTPDSVLQPSAASPAERVVRTEKRRPLKYGPASDAGFAKTCDRCGGDLKAHKLSWFTAETICLTCADAEDRLRREIRESGIPDAMEGYGALPGEADIAREVLDA